jgi:hypothetical protein
MSDWLPLDDPPLRPQSCNSDQVRATLMSYLRRVEGCALCGLLCRLEYAHVIRFGTAGRQNAEGGRDDDPALGLCNRHFWEMHRSFGGWWFVDKLFEILGQFSEELGPTGDGAMFSLPNLPFSKARCRICQELAQDERDYISVLAPLLGEAAFREVYQQSCGLCLPHVCVITEAAAAEIGAWLRHAEEEHWRRLRHDLAELQQKRYPQLRTQITPREESAPFRCVQKLVGAHGRPWPPGRKQVS